MNKKQIKGSCLCGEVTYQYSGDVSVFQYCHCSRCKKFTGAAYATNIIINPENFQWMTGVEQVSRYIHNEARHFATGFCKNCGSSLPWMSQSNKAIVIPAGTLDDDPEIQPKQNIFYADKAPWFIDSCDLPKHDELPK